MQKENEFFFLFSSESTFSQSEKVQFFAVKVVKVKMVKIDFELGHLLTIYINKIYIL